MSQGFQNYQATKMKKLPKSWRKARGLHNKVRRELRGKPARVKIGYGTANATAVEIFVIRTVADIATAVTKVKARATTLVHIGSTVGMKKKMMLLDASKKAGLVVENLHSNYSEKAKELVASRKVAREKQKEVKAEREVKRTAEKKDDKKDAKTKDAKDTTTPATEESTKKDSEDAEDEKKMKAKQEKDKVLISTKQ